MKKNIASTKKPATKLRKARIAAGLSQIELAEKMGFSNSAICQQEQRGCTTTESARLYARVLNVNPLDLIEL